jgi:magnesium transporter
MEGTMEVSMRAGVVNCAAYCNGKRVKELEIENVSEVLVEQDQFAWIGLHEPSEEILKGIQKEFCLHDLAIEDAHSAHERPKIEMYGDSIFLVMRTAQMNRQEQRIDFGETHIFLGARYIVSVRHGSSISYKDVRSRCELTPHLLRKGPGFALYALMDSIVDQYFPIIDELERQLEIIEEKIFEGVARRDTTTEIYKLKREMLEIKRAVLPLIDICNRLVRFDFEIIADDTRPYFRDVYDHVIRINEMVDTLRELLTSALEANFSLTSISQNEVTRKFAAWAAIIAVPTMIAGIYGMNFTSMPELHWAFGYPTVMIITIGFCLYLYRHFKRSDWL